MGALVPGGGEMNVSDLIEKLQAIKDGETPVMFWCDHCKRHIPIVDMQEFGFSLHNKDSESQEEKAGK